MGGVDRTTRLWACGRNPCNRRVPSQTDSGLASLLGGNPPLQTQQSASVQEWPWPSGRGSNPRPDTLNLRPEKQSRSYRGAIRSVPPGHAHTRICVYVRACGHVYIHLYAHIQVSVYLYARRQLPHYAGHPPLIRLYIYIYIYIYI